MHIDGGLRAMVNIDIRIQAGHEPTFNVITN